MNDDTRVALLIDADNLSGDVIAQAVEHLLKLYGKVHFRRAYSSPQKVAEHTELFKRYAIRPMVNVPTGKNSTDIALAVDAIDLAICESPDVVVIASSDSDYAPLAQRLREKGCVVLGIGQAGKTGGEAPLAYDEFIDLAHRKPREPVRPTRPAAQARTPRAGVEARGSREAVQAPAPRAGVQARAPREVTQAPAPREGTEARAPREATEARAPGVRAPRGRSRAAAPELVAAPRPAPPAVPPPAPVRAAAPAPSPAALPPEVASVLQAVPALRGGAPVQLGEVSEALRRHELLTSKRASASGFLKRFAAHFELVPADRPRTVRYRGPQPA